MEDHAIIALYFARKEEAVLETDRKYGSYCLSIARGILRDEEDAREAVNDTYLGAWRAIPPHRPVSLAAFLGKITRRVSINRFEANHAAKRGGGEIPLALDELAECIPGGENAEQLLEAKELTALLNTFVRDLPEDERRVFVCRYWYLEPVKTIAKRFSYSESKVKSMLLRTRGKLRRTLEKEGITV